jgi:hypothetical protein
LLRGPLEERSIRNSSALAIRQWDQADVTHVRLPVNMK